MDGWDELERRTRELSDLRGAFDLLSWDQETQLPPKGVAARGRQRAALEGVLHERLVDPRLFELLLRFQGERGLSPERAAWVRVLRRQAERARRTPDRLVRELALATSAAVEAWRLARAEGRFSLFEAPLARVLTLRREQADALGHGGTRYDALLDVYEPGATLASIGPIFARLVPELQRLASAIAESRPEPLRPFVGRRFDLARQWELSLTLLRAIGFDLQAGRLDRSTHPFTMRSHATDVRVTNRFREDDPLPGIFGALHEGGHGLYEQGFAPSIHGTPLAEACSFGLHESQSRLWENLVGRSLPFWRAFFPELRRLFPEALQGVDVERFWRAVNEVRPTHVRVEADEVTYNLHIALRLRIEQALISGELPSAELPSAWNEASREILGLVPPDDSLGVLQDIHWAWGDLGYFPTYTIGNLYSVILARAAERELPNLWRDVERGELSPLRDWLRRKIHAPGRLEEAEATVRAAAGEGLSEGPFVDYLWRKYGELYGVRR